MYSFPVSAPKQKNAYDDQQECDRKEQHLQWEERYAHHRPEKSRDCKRSAYPAAAFPLSGSSQQPLPRFPYCLIVFQSRENGYSIFAEQPLRQFVQKFALNFVESAYLQIGQNYLKY